MGIILRFPRHARPSTSSGDGAGGRAAKRASRSAVKPASRALAVSRIADHHSAGIVSRCGHLRTAKTLAPISAAKVSGEGHKPTTSRNVAMLMKGSIGQSVLKRKPILSRVFKGAANDNRPMAKSDEFRDEITTRVYSAREYAGLTQDQMAHVLGTTQTTYSKYETRSLLPMRYIWTFCLTCKVTVEWLVTGYGKGAPLLAKPEPQQRPGRRKGRRAA